MYPPLPSSNTPQPHPPLTPPNRRAKQARNRELLERFRELGDATPPEDIAELYRALHPPPHHLSSQYVIDWSDADAAGPNASRATVGTVRPPPDPVETTEDESCRNPLAQRDPNVPELPWLGFLNPWSTEVQAASDKAARGKRSTGIDMEDVVEDEPVPDLKDVPGGGARIYQWLMGPKGEEGTPAAAAATAAPPAIALPLPATPVPPPATAILPPVLPILPPAIALPSPACSTINNQATI